MREVAVVDQQAFDLHAGFGEGRTHLHQVAGVSTLEVEVAQLRAAVSVSGQLRRQVRQGEPVAFILGKIAGRHRPGRDVTAERTEERPGVHRFRGRGSVGGVMGADHAVIMNVIAFLAMIIPDQTLAARPTTHATSATRVGGSPSVEALTQEAP